MITVTKQIDGAILYYLDEPKEKAKKTYVLPTLVHNPYKFNFGMNWGAFEHTKEMTAEKTTDGNIIMYHDNIYQIKKIGGNFATEGIILSHNKFGKIFIGKGKTHTFYHWENVTYLCDNLEQFVRKYDLFGTN